ncbi:hypothetical protein HK097_000214 [Rhizophlyctis rosea]|uniref:Uncharacterized protein n=1 Tax=Rhizophlyctis rosea TaxID=64517 RepID=A0AAD5X1L8_9FUNG|nr:hypothetical protein HK097_000214 [Rhizophlyctis rosea]
MSIPITGAKQALGKIQTESVRWNAWRKSIQSQLPNPTSLLHAGQTSSAAHNNTPPLSPALSDHSDARSIKSNDPRESDSNTQDPVYDPSTGLISDYEYPDLEAEAAASLLRHLEDTIRSFKLDGTYDPLVRSLYCLADVVRYGPQPESRRKIRLGPHEEGSKEDWKLPSNPYLAFPRAAKSSKVFLLQAVDLARRFAASEPGRKEEMEAAPVEANSAEDGNSDGNATETSTADAESPTATENAENPDAPSATTSEKPKPTIVTAESPLFLELVSIMQDISALLHLCFTSTRAEVQWQAGDAARKMDGLAMRVLRAEDALPRLPPSQLEQEVVYSGCTFRDILPLSGTNGDPSAPEYIEARGGQSYFTGNPLQIVRVIRLLEVDRSSAEQIVKIRFPEAFELHKALVIEREKRLASAQLVPHHPEMAEIWKTNNFGISVEAGKLYEAVRVHLRNVGGSGALLEEGALEARYAASFPVEKGVAFVADLNSLIRIGPKAPLASWVLFNAHRQAAMDLAWLKCCRELESEIASLSIIPDSNQRQRHLLRERVRLVMEQAALIPSAPSLDPGPLTESDATGAVAIAEALKWDEPSGDASDWRKLHATLVRARDFLKKSAKPLDAVIRSMWTPITFPKEEGVKLADEFAGLGGQLAVALGGLVSEGGEVGDSGHASTRSNSPAGEEGKVEAGDQVGEEAQAEVEEANGVASPDADVEPAGEDVEEANAQAQEKRGLRRSTALMRKTRSRTSTTTATFDLAADFAAAQSDAERIVDAENEASATMFSEGVEKEEAGDLEEAFASYRIAARRGHAGACERIAKMYVQGGWLVVDYGKAKEWLGKAGHDEEGVERIFGELVAELSI